MARTFIIGDVHGHYPKLLMLLQNNHLIDSNLSWSGGDSTLAFAGDFFDRGPDGIAVLDLVMRLQNEAQRRGGRVLAVLGNHDFMILAAYRFGQQFSGGAGGNFVEDWKINGGNPSDLQRLNKRHIQWLLNLPAMVAFGDTLFLHADATFYMDYGLSIEEVNQSFRRVLHNGDAQTWDQMLSAFSEHRAFVQMDIEHVQQFLRLYNARRMVHGHTPIFSIINARPENVKQPLVYADNLCVNVDGCLYAGGSGFVYELV
ncbi:MAG: metallophosphoesterase [Anaerolineae bacterium]